MIDRPLASNASLTNARRVGSMGPPFIAEPVQGAGGAMIPLSTS